MSDHSDILLEERHGAVAVLLLNRPEKLHALNRAIRNRLYDALQRADDDPSIHVVILSGTGTKAFSAGADMLEVSGVEGVPLSEAEYRGPNRVTTMGIPVIAAINGYCFGGALALAIGCDIRIASTTATFRFPAAEYGLVVAAATAPRLMGAAKAKELIFTTRRFDAAEALACGLVNEVYEPDQLMPSALEMAQAIARQSSSAIRAAKQVIDRASLSNEAQLLEEEANALLRGTDEQVDRFRNATRRVTGR